MGFIGGFSDASFEVSADKIKFIYSARIPTANSMHTVHNSPATLVVIIAVYMVKVKRD
jgi:hypothetical protein